MPGIVAGIVNGGHDFKTSLMSGFETRLNKTRKSDLHFLLCTLLQARIQMNIDTDDHGEEGVTFSGITEELKVTDQMKWVLDEQCKKCCGGSCDKGTDICVIVCGVGNCSVCLVFIVLDGARAKRVYLRGPFYLTYSVDLI